MNKFIIFAVIALAAYASATPMEGEPLFSGRPRPDDSDEIAKLPGDMLAFSSYCRRSRDHVYDNIDDGQTLASTIISDMIDSAEDEALSQAERKLAEEEREISGQQIQSKNPFEHFLATVEKSRDKVVARVGRGLEALSKKIGLDQVSRMLEVSCDLVHKHESEIRAIFDDYKAEYEAEIHRIKPSLAKVEFEMVPCVTSTRVIRAERNCKFIRRANRQLSKLFLNRKHQASKNLASTR